MYRKVKVFCLYVFIFVEVELKLCLYFCFCNRLKFGFKIGELNGGKKISKII